MPYEIYSEQMRQIRKPSRLLRCADDVVIEEVKPEPKKEEEKADEEKKDAGDEKEGKAGRRAEVQDPQETGNVK